MTDLSRIARHKPRTTARLELVREERDPNFLPLLVTPATHGIDLVEWATAERDRVRALLLEHRAILFRGFGLGDVTQFRAFATAISDGELMSAVDESTPRTKLDDGVYNSTSYPKEQRIALHNEGSYCREWAQKLFFGSMIAATSGGETPLMDVREVLSRIRPEVVRRFEDKGVLYVRNYHPGVGLSWRKSFWTEDPAVVAAVCERERLTYEFKTPDLLRTSGRRPATRLHPVTGEKLWFNHAAFFNSAALPAPVREALVEAYGNDLPYETFYGDGERIEPEVIAEIVAAYTEGRGFAWEAGDLLVVDNMTIAHSRRPFEGERHVVVAMSEPIGDA